MTYTIMKNPQNDGKSPQSCGGAIFFEILTQRKPAMNNASSATQKISNTVIGSSCTTYELYSSFP